MRVQFVVLSWLKRIVRLNPNAALDALRQRYQRGEISRDEYEQLREELGEEQGEERRERDD